MTSVIAGGNNAAALRTIFLPVAPAIIASGNMTSCIYAQDKTISRCLRGLTAFHTGTTMSGLDCCFQMVTLNRCTGVVLLEAGWLSTAHCLALPSLPACPRPPT
ncbi:hypothetical protein ElyMa_000047900 [Elysia marginata]|uniref:Uncharacterized protein n=1 Tax=Elysia marginata TaxID=1093978 RepID=A0AAV4EDF5_9GAST|nr:hypothetical protein ElyMa_000047900 [Elysia marginata]